MITTWIPIDCLLCGNPPKALCDECAAGLPLCPREVSRRGLLPGFAFADYEGQAQILVHQFKLTGSSYLAQVMANPMVDALIEWLARQPAAGELPLVIVPAPSRPASIKHRGYVPAEVLAKALKRGLGRRQIASSVWNCVSFDRSVGDQSRLNALERSENLEGRVRVKTGVSSRLNGSRVVLLDDVVTTGSTIRNVALALEDSGVKPEIFLSFAETL